MLLDYQATSWGRRAFWLLVGVAVPVTLWMLRGGEKEKSGKDGASSSQPAQEAVKEAPQAAEAAQEAVKEAPKAAEAAQEAVKESPEAAEAAQEAVKEAPQAAKAAPEAVQEAPQAAEAAQEAVKEAFKELAIEIVDSHDAPHEGLLLGLDTKKAVVRLGAVLPAKEKVKLRVPSSEGALTLAAALESSQGDQMTFKLILNAGLRKRLERFLSEQKS